MNTQGADVLMAAAVSGVPQLRFLPYDGRGGFCSIALLLHAAGCRHLHYRVVDPSWFDNEDNGKQHSKCLHRMSYLFQIDYDEWLAIMHENSTLGHDYLTIAWRHCPNYGVRTAPAEEDDD